MRDVKVVTILGVMGKTISAIFASFGHVKVFLACRTKQKAEKAVEDAYKSVKVESIKSNLVPVTYDEIEYAIRDLI